MKKHILFPLFILSTIIVSCIKITKTEQQTTDQPVQQPTTQPSFPTMDQLDAQYQAQWNIPKYAVAKAADTASYLTLEEKKVCYYMNIVRINPKLFAATYATGYKGSNSYTNFDQFTVNENSLIAQLNSLDSLHALLPNKSFFAYADCQAKGVVAYNLKGLDGHNRALTGCPVPIAYAENGFIFADINALDIVMGWLNDSGNVLGSSQLGHRANCLDPRFNSLGLSIVNYGQSSQTAIADFSF